MIMQLDTGVLHISKTGDIKGTECIGTHAVDTGTLHVHSNSSRQPSDKTQ